MTPVERISALPDSVLCHILSFLPTKLAVATSILSNRWKALWLSVPTLDFDDQSYSENKDTYFRFVNFVHAVMLSRDFSQTLNRFRLKCRSSLCDPSNVNIWVNAAVQRKVEHLVLDLPHSTNLPPSVLKCRTLVVLELSGLTVDVLPSSFNFPSLKTLRLKRVRFGKHRYLGKLLSQCPIIEDLQMKSKISYKTSLEELQSLPKLVRADIYHACIPLTAISNVEFLRTTVVFPFYMNIPIPTFHNLTQMELVFMSYGWGWLVKVLKDCPKLQILVIDERMTESFSDDKDWAFPQSVPECLSLCLRTCTIINYIGQKGELQFARYIMQNARLLRTMAIQSTSSSNLPAKLKMITDLSLCPRSSILCELSFQ